MPAVCLILKIHEPHRLRHYSFFDIGASSTYVDEAATRAHLEIITTQCYLPATQILLKQIQAHKGAFRLSVLLSGVTLSLFEHFQPELLAQFQLLANTGCVEFIGESYFHSLSHLFSKPEFRQQLDLHRTKLKVLFGKSPDTFHCHAANFNNDLAMEADAFGFNVMLSRGIDRILEGRPLNREYQFDSCPKLRILFENPLLNDHLARLVSASNPLKPELTTSRFMTHLIHKEGEVITLPVNLQPFADMPQEESGLLEFLKQFPGAMLAFKGFTFDTPGQISKSVPPCASMSTPGFASAAETELETREWMGNEMQNDAIQGLYLLEREVKTHPDPAILLSWRQLQVSDHFKYMDTRQLTEDTQGAASNPYHSPYDAYINYMNILTDFSERLAVR